jgi:hypothetical protein
VARLSRSVPAERLFPLGMAGAGAVLLTMVGFPRMEVALATMALFGVPAMLWFVSAQTLVQRGAPDHLRGRVLGAYGATFGVAQLLGISTASVLGDLLDAVVLLVADGCLWLLAAGLAAVRLRRVRQGSLEQDAVVTTRS